MKRLLLLLLLFILCCDCSEFQGGVMTYHHRKTLQNGSVEMEIRHKTIFKSCTVAHFSCPSEGCVTLSYTDTLIDNATGNFCQIESVWTLRALSNAPFVLSPTVNEVIDVSFSALVDLRNRSDTGRPNNSPQATVPPIIRVPWNCPRYEYLATSDLDGDSVQCRFTVKNMNPPECEQCTTPSVIDYISYLCSFYVPSSSSNSSQGLYAVQMVLEDNSWTRIVLTQTDGTQEVKNIGQSLSKIPVQFLLSVEAAVPSCSLGDYLPEFVSSTPPKGAVLYVQVNEILHINITAQASNSTISALLFSGPSRMTKSGSGGQYVLSWSPVESEEEQTHPVCFSVQALYKVSSLFKSEGEHPEHSENCQYTNWAFLEVMELGIRASWPIYSLS
ncbi:hypothetical protein WMY93_015124 [Mugilogobius chulae]|uniref:Tectonic domain-containing protein n=1 Tax=Mugilogobius chulae TaxID=88201 RepID=A0AAW0P0P8_9GOBI